MKQNYDKLPEFDFNFHGIQIRWIDFKEIESIKLNEFISDVINHPTARVIHAICHDHNKQHNYYYDVISTYNKDKRILEITYEDKPTIPPTWDTSIKWIFIPGKLIIELDEVLVPEKIKWIEKNDPEEYTLEKDNEWFHFSG